MAEPLTTLDLAVVTLVVAGLAAAITALWVAGNRRVERLEKCFDELVKQMKETDEARIREVKEHAKSLESSNRHMASVFGRVVGILQKLTEAVSEWNGRPCLVEARGKDGKPMEPTPLPTVDTETLLKNDERVKRHQQEESAGP